MHVLLPCKTCLTIHFSSHYLWYKNHILSISIKHDKGTELCLRTGCNIRNWYWLIINSMWWNVLFFMCVMVWLFLNLYDGKWQSKISSFLYCIYFLDSYYSKKFLLIIISIDNIYEVIIYNILLHKSMVIFYFIS